MTQKLTPTKPAHRREMDLMGMLIVVGLVFFHSAQIFGGTGFYVQNTDQGMVTVIAANLLLAFGNLWGMPLMMLIIGFFVVQWPVYALVKYVVIVLGALATTLVVYDIAVRRTWPTRFLFGLRPKKDQS